MAQFNQTHADWLNNPNVVQNPQTSGTGVFLIGPTPSTKRLTSNITYQQCEDLARNLGATWSQFQQGLQASLTAALEPEVQRILLIDGPAVIGWGKWRKLESHRLRFPDQQRGLLIFYSPPLKRPLFLSPTLPTQRALALRLARRSTAVAWSDGVVRMASTS